MPHGGTSNKQGGAYGQQQQQQQRGYGQPGQMLNPQTKKERELFVGNIAPGVTGGFLQNFLNQHMLQLKLNVTEGAPIVNCHMSAKYVSRECGTCVLDSFRSSPSR